MSFSLLKRSSLYRSDARARETLDVVRQAFSQVV